MSSWMACVLHPNPFKHSVIPYAVEFIGVEFGPKRKLRVLDYREFKAIYVYPTQMGSHRWLCRKAMVSITVAGYKSYGMRYTPAQTYVFQLSQQQKETWQGLQVWEATEVLRWGTVYKERSDG